MKRLGFLASLAMLCASSTAFAVPANWAFEMSVAPSLEGAGVWTGRSDGSMATGGVQNVGTRTYAKGGTFSMSSVANVVGDAAAAGTANPQVGNPFALTGHSGNNTIEARFLVSSDYNAPGVISGLFAIENQALGTLHNNPFYGFRSAAAITSPATDNPNGQSAFTFFESSSPGPNNEFHHARIPGQGSLGGFDEIPLVFDQMIKLRIVMNDSGVTQLGTIDYYFDMEDGNGWRHATRQSAAGAYSNTRSRGLIFRKNNEGTVEIDYIRGVNQALPLNASLDAVPEPTGALLCSMAAGLLALARRRR